MSRNAVAAIIISLIMIGTGSLFFVRKFPQVISPIKPTEKKAAITSSTPSHSPTPVCVPRPTCTVGSNVCDVSESDNYCAVTPEWVVINYFKLFSYCIQNPPLAASGKVQQYCAIHNQFGGGKLSNNLTEQVEKGLSVVVCAQNPPETARISRPAKISADKATVNFSEQYGADSIDISYELEKEEGLWKVENIVCLK